MPSRPPSPPVVMPGSVCTGLTVGASASPDGAVDGPIPSDGAALADGSESPDGADPPDGEILRMRPLSRSVASAVPSGRNASPHGTVRPLATTSTATCVSSSLELGDTADGLGSLGGLPASSGGGGPKAQAVSALITSTDAA